MNESKKKNILIGGLLAVVLVMAVGYAAFATTLNITGTAQITSNWNVSYVAATTGSAVTTGVTPSTPTVGTAPTGTITYSADKLTATLAANLNQPGDTVTYELTPHNYGNITAKASTPVIKISGTEITEQTAALEQGTTEATYNNIKWTVSFTPKPSIGEDTDDNKITVTAEFVNSDNKVITGNEKAYLDVTILYNQYTS